jgi:autotransporter-associated beta strand protein
LFGSGSVTGSVTTVSGAKIYAGLDGVYATNVFNNNLTNASGSFIYLDVGTVYNSSNDLITVATNLVLNNTVFYLKAPGTSLVLDTTADYVLMTSANLTGSPAATPQWVVAPANASNFSVKTNGNNVVLHYTASTPPTGGGVASPATVVRNQSALISVTATNGSNPISTVTLDASSIGGSSTLSLVQSNASNVYTNTVTPSAGTVAGAKTLVATMTDSTALSGTTTISLTVSTASSVWNGGGADDNWSSNPNWAGGAAPGYIGDSVTFAGSVRPTPIMDTNYSVTGVTFDGTATSFTVGTANSSTLTLTGTGVTNNSVNAQMLNVPVVMSVAQTFNAAAGNLAFGQGITNGGNLITVAGVSNMVVNGAISGSGSLTKTANGTLTLGGNNTYTGTTTVNAGTANISGAINSANTASSAAVLVATTASTKAVMNISGTVNDNSGFLRLGTTDGASGVINVNGGTLNTSSEIQLGAADTAQSGFGAIVVNSGMVNSGSWIAIGRANTANSMSRGEFINNGGTVSVLANHFEIGSYQNYPTNYCVATLTGGTTRIGISSTSGGYATIGSSASGILNMMGNALLIVSNNSSSFLLGANSASVNGIANLNGGTVLVPSVTRGNGTGTLNFGGGTLKASKANATFMTGLTAAYVHSGGGTLDNNSFAITNAQALLAPTGSGVSVSSFTAGGAGYIAPPIIEISGGGGSNATAIAQIDGSGVITNVLITCPGVGFTSTPTINYYGGGGTGTPTVTLATTANTSGGMTFQGSGATTLSGVNTYTGNTTISAGTLALSGSGAIASSANIILNGGTVFDVSGLTSAFALGGSQTLSNSASATGLLKGNLNTGSGALALTYVSGTPAFNETSGTLNLSASTVLNLNNTGAQLGAGSYKIISASAGGSVTGTVPSSVAVGGNGVVAGGVSSLAISSGELYLVVTVTVNTTSTLGIAANPSTYGEPVTFTASVSPVPAGGTVQFYDNGVALDVPQNVDTGNGQAQLTLSTLAVGNHPITATYGGFGVYTIYTSSGSSVSNLVVTTQTPLVQSLPMASSITYGQSLAGSSLSGGTVTNAAGTTVAGAFTFANAAIVPNAGSTNVLVIFTPTDSVDYNQLTNMVAVAVSQASLTITANNTNKVYGQTVTLAGTEFTTSGLTNGDSVTSVTLTSDGAVNTATMGSYPITASAATGTGLGNYNISYVAGTLTVNPLVASLAGTRAYNGTTNALAADLAVTNVVNGDIVTLTGTGGLAGANVGTNDLTSYGDLALSGGAGTNYTLVGATGSMVITNTPLLITANNDSKTYDGVPYGGGNGVTYAGFVNGETNTDLAGSLSYTGTSQGATTVSGYDITPTGYTSTNYLISYVSGTLTINQATSVINTAPAASTIIYGQTLGDSILSGGSATPTGGSFAFTSPATVPPVGTAAYGVTYTPADTVNYTTATTSVNVTVNPACTAPTIVGGIDPGSLTVSAFNPVVLTLTNATGTAPFTYQWLSNSVAISGATNSSYTNLSVSVADAGNYQVVVANDCGAITSSVAMLTVNPQTPLIAAAPTAMTSITYGQTLSAAGLTGGSVTNAVGATVTGIFTYTTPSATPNAGTGSQGVTFTSDDTANYTTATTTVSVTVDKATPTATLVVNNSPVTYTGLGQAATVSVTASNTPGAVANILTGGAASQSNAGTYAVTADYVPDDTANYNTLTAVAAGNFTIQPVSASVTADAKSKTYGDGNPTLTATVLGTVNGDVLNYTLATDATQFSSVGVSNITVSLGSNPNYEVLVTNSTLTIGTKAASVTANNTSKIYGQTVTFAGTEFTTGGLVGGDAVTNVTLTSAGAVNTAAVNTYPITASAAAGTGLGNYNLSYVDGTLTVTAGTPLTINAPVVLPDGNVQLTFVGGDAGVSYQIQASTNLTGLVWSSLITNTAGLGGLSSYTDLDATNHVIRFYRTVTP